jgi:biotin carboxyl carrier protein
LICGALICGALICVVEARKMEKEVRAQTTGIVRELSVAAGRAVASGQIVRQLE